MATKDISDAQVCEAVALRDRRREGGQDQFVTDILAEKTGQPLKVCEAAMKRAHRRGLIDFGVSLRTAWLTESGRDATMQTQVSRREFLALLGLSPLAVPYLLVSRMRKRVTWKAMFKPLIRQELPTNWVRP